LFQHLELLVTLVVSSAVLVVSSAVLVVVNRIIIMPRILATHLPCYFSRHKRLIVEYVLRSLSYKGRLVLGLFQARKLLFALAGIANSHQRYC
jgi:hypothetical protein